MEIMFEICYIDLVTIYSKTLTNKLIYKLTMRLYSEKSSFIIIIYSIVNCVIFKTKTVGEKSNGEQHNTLSMGTKYLHGQKVRASPVVLPPLKFLVLLNYFFLFE